MYKFCPLTIVEQFVSCSITDLKTTVSMSNHEFDSLSDDEQHWHDYQNVSAA